MNAGMCLKAGAPLWAQGRRCQTCWLTFCVPTKLRIKVINQGFISFRWFYNFVIGRSKRDYLDIYFLFVFHKTKSCTFLFKTLSCWEIFAPPLIKCVPSDHRCLLCVPRTLMSNFLACITVSTVSSVDINYCCIRLIGEQTWNWDAYAKVIRGRQIASHSVLKLPVLFNNCIGVPISRLLTI